MLERCWCRLTLSRNQRLRAVAEAAEDAAEVFEITAANRYAARFMTITCAVRPQWRSRIPAVVHVDGTARPQLVERRQNPLYYEILQRFKELSKGKTAVLISHRFSSVRMADRIVVLGDGRVEAAGTHEALLAQGGRYAELFELQAAGYR